MIDLRYDCERERLGPALAARFRPLTRDEETDAWLAQHARPHGVIATKLAELLGAFATTYDVHALLGVYPMHLLSERAWGDLLVGQSVASLLDVGAGAGFVTARARVWANELVCVETSRGLVRRLQRRGLAAHHADLSTTSLGRAFDAVCCFNVLDRTARPLSLLAALIAHLAPQGRLLISIPLPPAPHVHVRGATIAPTERLPSVASDWETAARELSERLFAPAGLSVQRLVRVPYLSRGDAYAARYVLDAALWVLRLGERVQPDDAREDQPDAHEARHARGLPE